MAYLMLVVGVLYSVTWGMGLMFASKSDAPRNTIVPAIGLLAFLGRCVCGVPRDRTHATVITHGCI